MMVIASVFNSKFGSKNYNTGVFKLSDGGEIKIESNIRYEQASRERAAINSVNETSKPLIIIIPGIMGTVDDHYHKTFTSTAEKHDYDWLLVNYRGIRHPLKSNRPFTLFDFDDFEEVIRDVISQNGGKR